MRSLKLILNSIYRMQKRSADIDERIQTLKALIYPKAQTISDMPRGGKTVNSIESYAENIEYWEDKKKSIQTYIDELKKEAETELHRINASADEIKLIKYKYYLAMTWKDTSVAMNWTLGKCYSVHNRLFKKYFKKSEKSIDMKVKM